MTDRAMVPAVDDSGTWAPSGWEPAETVTDDSPFGSVLGDPLMGSPLFDVSVLDASPTHQEAPQSAAYGVVPGGYAAQAAALRAQVESQQQALRAQTERRQRSAAPRRGRASSRSAARASPQRAPAPPGYGQVPAAPAPPGYGQVPAAPAPPGYGQVPAAPAPHAPDRPAARSRVSQDDPGYILSRAILLMGGFILMIMVSQCG